MLRFVSVVLLCVFFVACGDKKASVLEGGSSDVIEQKQEKKEEVIQNDEEVIEEYVPQAKVLQESQLQVVYFAFDSFALSKEAFSIVNQNAEILKQYPNAKILLEGNTDAYGSDEYNFALGNKRALAVKEALMVRGIQKQQISIVSYGETKPVCTTDNSAECHQKNRRVNFVLEAQ